jgi:hypothetical protein
MYNIFNKSYSLLFFLQVFLIFIFIYLLYLLVNNNYYSYIIEGYDKQDNFLFKKETELYDDKYFSHVYDYLEFNNVYDNYMIGTIINKTNPSNQSIILDIGNKKTNPKNIISKIFNNTCKMNTNTDSNINILGINNSLDVSSKVTQQYPNYTFKLTEEINFTQMNNETFTHILCINMNIYSIEDKNLFLYNSYQWLMPGGFLILHLVKPNKNIILNLDTNIDTDTSNNLKHVIDITNKYNNTIDYITKLAFNNGFIIYMIADVTVSNYCNQYLYIFTKPN